MDETETPKRIGKKWSIPEILSLQREYQLLNMSIDEIANKHKRTPKAIMYKLSHENFAASYDTLLYCYNNKNNFDIDDISTW